MLLLCDMIHSHTTLTFIYRVLFFSVCFWFEFFIVFPFWWRFFSTSFFRKVFFAIFCCCSSHLCVIYFWLVLEHARFYTMRRLYRFPHSCVTQNLFVSCFLSLFCVCVHFFPLHFCFWSAGVRVVTTTHFVSCVTHTQNSTHLEQVKDFFPPNTEVTNNSFFSCFCSFFLIFPELSCAAAKWRSYVPSNVSFYFLRFFLVFVSVSSLSCAILWHFLVAVQFILYFLVVNKFFNTHKSQRQPTML